MYKKTNQQGIGALVIVLVLVMAGIVGFTGWYVLNSQKQIDKAQRQAERAESGTGRGRSGHRAQVKEYAEVPKELQAAILAATKTDAPKCLKGDTFVDGTGKTVAAHSIEYMESGFALTLVGCDADNGGNTSIFAKQQDNSWKKVASTVADKHMFKCSDLQTAKVPSTLIRSSLNGTKEVRCIPDDTKAGDYVIYKDTKS